MKELLRYVISDLKQFRVIRGDESLGGMVICETSEQARRLFAYFDEIQNELNQGASNPSHFKAGLILYDSDDKEIREGVITDFKTNFKIDILIVFNMLLTGFDAPRLKRLYFGRKLKDHHLNQSRIAIPPLHIADQYGRKVSVLYDKYLECANENQELSSLRDFLLPLLMNGQVKVE